MFKMDRPVTRFALVACLALILSVMVVGTVAADSHGDPACPGSLPNQLSTVGQTGRLTRYFSTLRAAPAGEPILYVVTPAEFIVALPPDGGASVRCAEADGVNLYFVYIEYTSGMYVGQEGWANESQIESIYGADQYWLEPYTPAPVEPDCSASLPNQLNFIGQTGAVSERFSTLRSAPGGAPIVRVDFPASFVVAQPPDAGSPVRCVNGYVFVYIQYQDGNAAGQAGWALESERVSIYGYDKYWIEPAA